MAINLGWSLVVILISDFFYVGKKDDEMGKKSQGK
jgi:hypothetical protein